MKPAPFAYAAPTSLSDALARLADEDARPLAGGQSLIPMLNFRLARPALLVDLGGVRELDGLEVVDGALRIGAMTRQSALLRSEAVARHWPLLAQAGAHVGHAAIRNRGTVGGSVAHADPAAELPVALTALDARFRIDGPAGPRTLEAADFFVTALVTALDPGELLVAIEVPPPAPGVRMAFSERARTHGDFAEAGVAVVLTPDRQAALALLGAGPAPVRVPAAEEALRDGRPADEVAALATAGIDDDYRRALLRALVRRTVTEVRR